MNSWLPLTAKTPSGASRSASGAIASATWVTLPSIEVTAEHDDVGPLRVDLLDDALGEGRVAHRAEVQVGDERDPQAVEARGQLAGW